MAQDILDDDTPFTASEVPDGAEMHRILCLPTRPAPSAVGAAETAYAAAVTAGLTRSPEPYPGRLLPLQAHALKEAYACRGLAGFVRTGGGKMLLSALLPVVLRSKASSGRWLIMSQASMRDDTVAEFAKFAQHWPTPPTPEFLSYEMLANPNYGEDLAADGSVARLSYIERLHPSVLILDEAHKASALAGKRVAKFLAKHPDTIVVVMTATPFQASIREAAKIMEWALRDRSPLPRPSVAFAEIQAWSGYLDHGNRTRRPQVGALLRLLTRAEMADFATLEGDDEAQRSIVRRAVARRMYATPGVMSSQEGKLVDARGRAIGLTLGHTSPDPEDPAIEAAFGDLRRTWSLPDGTTIEDGLAFARHAQCFGLGFYQVWSPAPPIEYREAWRGWASWLQHQVRHNHRGIDSEARMVRALRKGLYNDGGLLSAWRAAQAEYTRATGLKEPPSVTVWISDEAVDAAVAWAYDTGGAVWTRYRAIGERVAAKLGVPFYSARSRDAVTKAHVKDHRSGPAVLSIQSCGTGKQLTQWSHALWLTAPTEQALARHHRSGQKADVVHNVLYIGCPEHLDAFVRARDGKARAQEDFTLQSQKMRYADFDLPDTVYREGSARWSKAE